MEEVMRSQTQTIALSPGHIVSKSPQVIQTLFDCPALVGTTITFPKGAEIYGENEPADYVYRVLSGTVRSYRILSDGRRQIEGFHFSGDIFGLETGAEHSTSTEAVSPVTALIVRRSAVYAAAEQDKGIAIKLWKLMARELDRARNHSLLLMKSAQERVAAFLLDMARFSTGNFVDLPMSRQDIADYLGLTIETVSRTISQFHQEQAIELPNSRRIVLRNLRALASLNA
jgi:CRP/FNR family nitrogen fixation transcriptional regulator